MTYVAVFSRSTRESPRESSALLVRLAFVIILLSGVFWGGSVSAQDRIALFQFEDYSQGLIPADDLMTLVRRAIAERGYSIIPDEEVLGFLVKERIRSTAYTSREEVRKMHRELGISAILMGSVYEYAIKAGTPMVGITARFVDARTGDLLWSGYASAAGEDFTGLLGLGTVTEVEPLAAKMVSSLFSGFDGRAFPKVMEQTYQIAVTPFLNKSTWYGAGNIVGDMFAVAMAQSPKFRVVEFGDVRKVLVETRSRAKGEIDYDSSRAIAAAAGIDGIVVGVVETYSDGTDTNSPPGVVISARLLDTRENRILWVDRRSLEGDDLITFLDRGKMRSVDKVAYTTVKEMVRQIEKTEWNPRADVAAAR